jgi:hypothetical protein
MSGTARDSTADLTLSETEALKKGGFVLQPDVDGGEDPLTQTAAEYAALLSSSLSMAEAAKRLGLAPSHIQQRLTSEPPRLYGIRIGTSWYIPEIQFDGNELVCGIGEIVSQLDPELHPIAVLRWLTTPSPDLPADEAQGRNLSPRDWLRLGLPVQPVADLAASL